MVVHFFHDVVLFFSRESVNFWPILAHLGYFGDLIHLLKEVTSRLGKINTITGTNTYLAGLQHWVKSSSSSWLFLRLKFQLHLSKVSFNRTEVELEFLNVAFSSHNDILE